jgi:hypothetical protein
VDLKAVVVILQWTRAGLGWFSFESDAYNTLHATYEIPCSGTAFVFHQIGCFRGIIKNLEKFLLEQDRKFPRKNIIFKQSHLLITPINSQNRATTEWWILNLVSQG